MHVVVFVLIPERGILPPRTSARHLYIKYKHHTFNNCNFYPEIIPNLK